MLSDRFDCFGIRRYRVGYRCLIVLGVDQMRAKTNASTASCVGSLQRLARRLLNCELIDRRVANGTVRGRPYLGWAKQE